MLPPSLSKRAVDIEVALAFVLYETRYGSKQCLAASKRRRSTMLVDQTVIALFPPTTPWMDTENTTQNTTVPKTHRYHHHTIMYFLVGKMAPASI
jgi:hypothetical protein